jgi:hypothetical protein
VVSGGPLPCGAAVCNPPQICCEGGGMGGGATCQDPGATCMGVAVSCTADTCPAGSVCCASVSGFRPTSTQCQQGACGGSERQLCSPTVPCPSGETCRGLGGAVSFCGMPRPDGGFMPPDGGFPMRDATTD